MVFPKTSERVLNITRISHFLAMITAKLVSYSLIIQKIYGGWKQLAKMVEIGHPLKKCDILELQLIGGYHYLLGMLGQTF